MKRTVLYLDTEENRINKVKGIIKETLVHSETLHAQSLETAYKILLERTIDIFIINIALGKTNVSDTEGLRFIARIREIPKYILTPVIILSSMKDPQLYAYEELNCLGYLNKSFAHEKLRKLLLKASHFKTRRTGDKMLVFRKKRILHPVLIKDIVYMVRENGITMVHMANGDILDVPYITYTKLLYDADDSSLFLCNRSTIVNRNYVYAIDPTSSFIVLKEKRGMLDIGMGYRSRVLAEFTNT